jgi:pimeloyl-ACP methyl ester carboxylesterase
VGKFVRRFYMHDASVAGRLGPLTRQMMAKAPIEVARSQAWALDTQREMVPLIAGYAGPVEVIVGAEDKVCPPVLHGPIAAALSGAVYTEIPDCGASGDHRGAGAGQRADRGFAGTGGGIGVD